ncbi:MAG: DUF1236 domain-containing protein [Proteobacteria bacterium]|nr:DUF1236 domain-containing protein [Pseudomonadota bacterium]
MIKTRLLCGAAAVVAFGIGSAFAQQANPEPAPATQQNVPPAKIAPPMNAGQHGPTAKPETTGQAPSSLKPGRNENVTPHGSGVGAPTGQAPQASKGSEALQDNATDTSGKDTHSRASNAANESTKDAQSSTKSSSKNSATTTGQGAAGAHASLTTEQRSKITTVIKQQKVKPVHLNVTVKVGTRIPQHVRYYPLPTEVVTIYPEWRGFDYILVGDTIVVIDPGTREIVAVIET